MADSTFQLKYVGRRFDAHALPIECIVELMAVQRALLELFRAKYLSAHPDRKRLPKGSKEEFKLVLRSLERGSTIACLAPMETSQGHPSFFYGDAATQAFEDFIGLIDNPEGISSTSEGPPVMLEEKQQAKCFREFGASLQDEESIELSVRNGVTGRVVRYDQAVRQRLLRRLNVDADFTRNDELAFAVSAFNKDPERCTLETPQGHKLEIEVAPNNRDLLLGVFDGYSSHARNVKVLVEGTFTFSADGQPKAVEVESIEGLGDRDLRWRIPYLKRFNQDSASSLRALSAFETAWNQHFEPRPIPHPALYLLEDGAVVSAEWDWAGGEVSLTYSADGLFLLTLSPEGLELESQEFDTVDDSAWDLAAEWIGKRLPQA